MATNDYVGKCIKIYLWQGIRELVYQVPGKGHFFLFLLKNFSFTMGNKTINFSCLKVMIIAMDHTTIIVLATERSPSRSLVTRLSRISGASGLDS